jgi:SAM-dependent methyltransferase
MSTAEVQGELWGQSPQRWSQSMEPVMRPLFEAAVSDLEPLAGQRLLDAGCGAGLFLSLVAARGAIPSGLDASEALLSVARSRLPSVDLRVAGIEALPYDDGAFDIVTAFNAIQYTVDPGATLKELARVARPGGRVGIGVWGYPERCESEQLFDRLRALAPPPPGTPAPLAVSDPGVVEKLLLNAGVHDVRSIEAQCPFAFPDMETAWLGWASAGPLIRVIRLAGEAAVRRVVEEALLADRKPDGALREDNAFRFVVGTKAVT